MKIKHYDGAGVALFRKTENGFEIFLGKRSIKMGFGKWSIPGGAKERYDKNFQIAAFREFREETGLDFSELNAKLLGTKRFSFPYFKWETFIYLTDNKEHKFYPCEFSEFKWILLSELKKYQLAFGVKAETRKFLRLVNNI